MTEWTSPGVVVDVFAVSTVQTVVERRRGRGQREVNDEGLVRAGEAENGKLISSMRRGEGMGKDEYSPAPKDQSCSRNDGAELSFASEGVSLRAGEEKRKENMVGVWSWWLVGR